MRVPSPPLRSVAFAGVLAILVSQTTTAQSPAARPRGRSAPSTPTIVQFSKPAGPAAPAGSPHSREALASYDRQRLLAGHLLRRIGFGPTPVQLEEVLAAGTAAYLERQLDPATIDDSMLEPYLDGFGGRRYDIFSNTLVWYLRLAYSNRQLQEKMTLFWHEHFATSFQKVQDPAYMAMQEDLLREHALGNFRQLLVEITKDPAMLVWLDNNNNSGTAKDSSGNPIPPNENYARELMQLFAVGTTMLNMDGTPALGTDGNPVPAYTESDVREVARALTGWVIKKPNTPRSRVVFKPKRHDSGDKTIFGTRIAGRRGADGAREVEDVVDLLMRHPSTAPFISKEMIMKLATETPTPGYVERVATVFKQTNGDVKATVRALFTDPEFTADASIRTQFKTPIELWVSTVRALAPNGLDFDPYAYSYGFYEFTYRSKHLLYHPPSVFSFYRPGQKGSLVNTGLALTRDTAFDELLIGFGTVPPVDGGTGVVYGFDMDAYLREYQLDTPEKVVDFFAERLLTAPLQPDVRQDIVDYMGGFVSRDRALAAVWLILCTPDFQVN